MEPADSISSKIVWQRKRWETYHATREELHTLFPGAFPARGQPVPPLKIGIAQEIKARTGMPWRKVQSFLRVWAGRRVYQDALAAGGERVGLDGEPAGEVDPAHVAYARHQLGRRWGVQAAV